MGRPLVLASAGLAGEPGPGVQSDGGRRDFRTAYVIPPCAADDIFGYAAFVVALYLEACPLAQSPPDTWLLAAQTPTADARPFVRLAPGGIAKLRAVVL